jgi:outer membrane lipoprotein SlyB
MPVQEELRKETRKQAMAMVAGIFGQAVGSSVGSLIKPGQGTYVGGLVGATLADLIDFEAVDNKIMAGR